MLKCASCLRRGNTQGLSARRGKDSINHRPFTEVHRSARNGDQSKSELRCPVVPSIYSIVPPNDGSALRHGHHFEPVDFVIDHGRGHHDAYSAGSCRRAYAGACGCRQRPRCHREELIEIRAGVVRPRGVRNDDADRRPWARKRPFRTRPAERVVHPVCPCRSTGGSLNRDNSRGMSQECAANAAR